MEALGILATAMPRSEAEGMSTPGRRGQKCRANENFEANPSRAWDRIQGLEKH